MGQAVPPVGSLEAERQLGGGGAHLSFTSLRYRAPMHAAGQIVVPMDRTDAPRVRLVRAPATGELHAEIHSADAIPDQLARDWSDLAADASEPNSFGEYWFMAASLAAFGRRDGIRVVAVRRDAQLIGVVPLSIEENYGRIRVRNVQNWIHHQTFLGVPLVRRGEERSFWAALLRLLDEADWAPNFLHVCRLVADGPVHDGLRRAAAASGRGAPIVHRKNRAMLSSSLDPASYFEQAVRPKKRKEIRRLRNRLGEMGRVEARTLADESELDHWCAAFLALEQAGWKGREGSALAGDPDKQAFFRAALAAAWSSGRLQFLRLDLDGRPIAMLVNFLSPPGSFSFKTAYDEAYAHFSPGVLIQLENLKILERADIEWMDSCACENHPMIDSLWRERRELVRVTVRLGGVRRGLVFAACRLLETAWHALRQSTGPKI